MKSKLPRILYSFLILVVLMACSLTSTITPNEPVVNTPASSMAETSDPASTAQIAFEAETDGPAGFTATLSSPDIVSLAWETVTDAVGYEVQIVFDGLDPRAIAFLPADAASFTHFMATESSLLTYRLQTITSNGPGGASSLQIRTEAHVPNPFTVQASFSESGISSAVIGPEGGALDTTDERGVKYSLVIPPQALDTELEITMTPVSSINGWPMDGGLVGAVRLEPEGWLLNEVAMLTISIPEPISDGMRPLAFAFNGSGNEFHLTPSFRGQVSLTNLGMGATRVAKLFPQQDVVDINLPITELKPSGLGEASAQAAAQFAKDNPPTSSNDSADQKAAVTEALDDELAPLMTNDQLGMLATEKLLDQIINSKDCYDFKRAEISFRAWESKVTQSNGDHFSYYEVDRKAILESLAKKAVETIENSSDECTKADKGVVPASVPCAEKLTRNIQSASNPFYAELQNTMKSIPGLLDRLTAADSSSQNCPHSFIVNEAASFGFRWTGACIPSLDRSYQLTWVGADLSGKYLFYPSGPFSGRVNGDGNLSLPGGFTTTYLYEGSYRIEVTKQDNEGYPREMDAVLTLKTTTTQCIEGNCVSFTDDDKQLIPLLVNKSRCAVP